MLYSINGPFPKKPFAPSEKVTPNEDIEKVTKFLHDTKEPVFIIRRTNLDKFYGAVYKINRLV